MGNRTVCYWILGEHNTRQAPAMCLDLHDASGDLIAHEYRSRLPRTCTRRAARALARTYARRMGATKVYHDTDSTNFGATS